MLISIEEKRCGADRRRHSDRRKFSYHAYSPERRTGIDRRVRDRRHEN